MPIYEYQCAKCGTLFEDLRSFSEREDAAACPKCGHGKSALTQGSYRINTKHSASSHSHAGPCGCCHSASTCPSRRE